MNTNPSEGKLFMSKYAYCESLNQTDPQLKVQKAILIHSVS